MALCRCGMEGGAVMKRLDRSEEFMRNLEALAVEYKIKRNFIKLMERKRKSLCPF